MAHAGKWTEAYFKYAAGPFFQVRRSQAGQALFGDGRGFGFRSKPRLVSKNG